MSQRAMWLWVALVSLGLTAGAVAAGPLAAPGGFFGGTILGQLVLTLDPPGSTSADATLRINPATSAANERFVAVQDNGTDRFIVDKEGDQTASGATVQYTNASGVTISSVGAASHLTMNAGSNMVLTGVQFGGVFMGTTSATAGAINQIAAICEGPTAGGACVGDRQVRAFAAGLVSLGETEQAQTVSGAANLDPQSSVVMLTCSVAASTFAVTMQETSAAGAQYGPAHGAEVRVCSSPDSNATCVMQFADVAGVFNGTTFLSGTGLGVGDCFTMTYVDSTNDQWLVTGVADN